MTPRNDDRLALAGNSSPARVAAWRFRIVALAFTSLLAAVVSPQREAGTSSASPGGPQVQSACDSSFVLFGPKTYVRSTGKPVTVVDTFPLPPDAGAPFTLHLVNGLPDSSNRVSSATVRLNGVLVIEGADLGTDVESLTRQVTLAGTNVLEVRLASTPNSQFTLRVTGTDTAAPVLVLSAPADSQLTGADSVDVAGTVTAGPAVTVTVDGFVAQVGAGGAFAVRVPLPIEGWNAMTVVATEGACSATTTRSVRRDTQAPVLVTNEPQDGAATTAPDIVVNGTVTDSSAFTLTVNGDPVPVGAGGAFSHTTALALGANIITVTATDVLGHASTETRNVTRNPSGPPLPPDPSLVAPALDPTGVTPFYAATAFLYAGNPPIQTGVASGTIAPVRAAVIRGRVVMRDGQALPGATITVKGHPEFGQTLSRADGRYDMAVNGGGTLVVDFSKTGFLPAQRSVTVPWRDFAVVDSVAMVGIDPEVTAVSFVAPIEVHQASTASDTDGTRRATLLFEQGTTATMVMPDGSTQSLGTLHVRATEFTVGPLGETAMPAALPSTSAYTYAAALTVDEAVAAGAVQVNFSRPVPFYVENFLEFPVGIRLPVGYYDRLRGQWAASPDGRVIKILAETSDVADVDITGDDIADSASALNAIGLDAAERGQLAALYDPGQSLWRAELPHFSDVDVNLPCGNPTASPPNAGLCSGFDGSSCQLPPSQGSILECETQVLGEQIQLVGAPMSLNYRSYRVPGHLANDALLVPVTGATTPAGLSRVAVYVEIAGRSQQFSFSPAAGQRFTFQWDGMDPYGRRLHGRQPVKVAWQYFYPGTYRTAGSGTVASFGLPCAGAACNQTINVPTRRSFFITRRQNLAIGVPDMTAAGLGSWSLDVHHAYDPNGNGTTFFGNGSRRVGGRLNPIVVSLGQGASDVRVGPDGSLYLLRSEGFQQDKKLRRFFPDGTSQVIFSAAFGYGGDGGPASAANFNEPNSFALAPDGSIYVADTDNSRLRRIGTDGIVNTVAGGNGFGCTGAREGPGTSLSFNGIYHVAAGPDGSVYFTSNCAQLYRLSTDGNVSVMAGDGTSGFSGDGGPATLARISGAGTIAVGPDGSVYLGDQGGFRVRRVSPIGIITTFAGNGSFFGGDGGPATSAGMFNIGGLEVGPDGTVYISTTGNHRVRAVSPEGIIRTVAGSGVDNISGDGGPATAAGMYIPGRLALDNEGRLDVITFGALRQVRPWVPGFTVAEYVIASEDASELYAFDALGRHLRTVDGLTGAVRWRFTYDAAHRLVSARDMDGNVTSIERDGLGNPTAIVGPYGHRTTLGVDGNGYLASVTDPAGGQALLVADFQGLLRSYRDPRGGLYEFDYDNFGWLREDRDPAGGVQQLARTELPLGHEVTRTTAEGRSTAYRTEVLSTGDSRRTLISPSGHQSTAIEQTNDVTSTTYPDASTRTSTKGPDPRFGMQSPIAASLTVRFPSGLTSTVTGSRSITGFDASVPLGFSGVEQRSTLNGRQFLTRFDAAPRRFTLLTPAGRQTIIRVDSAGRPLAARMSGLDSILSTYDARGRLATTRRGGRLWSYSYDDSGRLARSEDPLLRVHQYEYDADDRMVRHILPDLRAVRYGYDANGNLTSVVPPGRPGHAFDFTAVNLNRTYVPPDIGVPDQATHLAYNRDRQLESVSRPGGAVVSLDYDAAGRISSVTIPRGSIGYSYSSATGRMTGLTSPDSVAVSYQYDGALLTSEQWAGPVTGAVSWTYDTSLRLASQSINGGSTVALGYDPDGLLTSVGALTLTRAPATGLLSGSVLGSLTTSQGYTSSGEVATIEARFAGSQIFALQYDRDSLGRITRTSETVQGSTGTYEYAYDPAGRLSTVRTNGLLTHQYGYDPNGNRSSFEGATPSDTLTGAYDDQDRLLRYGAATYSYAANGELKERVENGDSLRVTYDELGNATLVRLPNGDRIEYLIDGNNRRVGKRVNGALVRAWVYQSPLAPVAEFDGAGNLVSRFVYGSRMHVPDYVVKGGATYRIVTDHIGSVRLVVDAVTGAVVQRLRYDPWGIVLEDTNPGFQPFGFAGGLFDPDTRLVRFGARDYDSQIGRWTLKDPIGFDGGATSIYVYADNNPIMNFDPTGLSAAAAAMGGAARDITFPDASDASMAKWLAWGAIILIAEVYDLCNQQPCPPCKTLSGKVVPVGTIAYRPLDTPPQGRKQHGIEGPHYNLYRANQNPGNCMCFWQPIGAVPAGGLPPGAIPIEPFM